MWFTLKKDIFNHRDINYLLFLNNGNIFFMINVHSDDYQSALNYHKDTEIMTLYLILQICLILNSHTLFNRFLLNTPTMLITQTQSLIFFSLTILYWNWQLQYSLRSLLSIWSHFTNCQHLYLLKKSFKINVTLLSKIVKKKKISSLILSKL